MSDLGQEYIYSIGEVSEMLNIKEHTLRFWEKEFSVLKPKRTINGRRGYSPEDIDLLQTIKRLLYDQGFTTKGALKEIMDNQMIDVVVEKEEETLFSLSDQKEKRVVQERNISEINQSSLNSLLGPKQQAVNDRLESKVQQELVEKLKHKVNHLITLWENYNR